MNLPVTLAGISKAVAEMNKPHRERQQERLAKILFEWWWATSDDPAGCCLWNKYSAVPPLGVAAKWEDCEDHAQAHWMEGSWRIMRG